MTLPLNTTWFDPIIHNSGWPSWFLSWIRIDVSNLIDKWAMFRFTELINSIKPCSKLPHWILICQTSFIIQGSQPWPTLLTSHLAKKKKKIICVLVDISNQINEWLDWLHTFYHHQLLIWIIHLFGPTLNGPSPNSQWLENPITNHQTTEW